MFWEILAVIGISVEDTVDEIGNISSGRGRRRLDRNQDYSIISAEKLAVPDSSSPKERL